MLNTKTEAEMLACARRELALRKNVYPRWIESGRLTPDKAQHEIECMESICALIEKYKMLGEVSEDIKRRDAQRATQPEESESKI